MARHQAVFVGDNDAHAKVVPKLNTPVPCRLHVDEVMRGA
jgi:hypothetical protein